MAVSTIFNRNISVIDHAYINHLGQVVGGSYHLNVDIGGSIENNEQVVVDFSRIKKDIKEIVDSKEDGFDHKLWLITGYSRANVIFPAFSNNAFVHSNACWMQVPKNAIKQFDGTTDVRESAELAIQKQLQIELSKKYPNSNLFVKVSLTTEAFTINKKSDNFSFFTYSHGLKNSSSWGCQNVGHGHLSFIEWFHDSNYSNECSDCMNAVKELKSKIAELDGAVFVFSENIESETEKEIKIKYTTERGEWIALYKKEENNIVVLPIETTVENITNWFVTKYDKILAQAHIKQIRISEGLAKGALVNLSV